MLAALALLAAAGAVLAGGSLAGHLGQFKAATSALAPGPTGAALLLLAQAAYLPNAIIWAVAYMAGPGFAVGAGTVVAPTGSALGPLPAFPMLAALPTGARSAGSLLIIVMAVPFLAGIFAGIVTVRVVPTPVIEVAALWGLVAGAAAGAVTGLAAAFSGGPLGDGRLAAVGPSGWQVGLVCVLEIGVTAALTAAAANWLLLRRILRSSPGRVQPDEDQPGADQALAGDGLAPESFSRPFAAPLPAPAAAGPAVLAGVVDERDDASGHRIYVNPWAAGPGQDRGPGDDDPDDDEPFEFGDEYDDYADDEDDHDEDDHDEDDHDEDDHDEDDHDEDDVGEAGDDEADPDDSRPGA